MQNVRRATVVAFALCCTAPEAGAASGGLWTGKIEVRQETTSADDSARIIQTVTINARLREVGQISLAQLPINGKLTNVLYEIQLSSEGSRMSATYTRTGSRPCSSVRSGISNQEGAGAIRYRAVADALVADADLRQIPLDGVARIMFSGDPLIPWSIRCGEFDFEVPIPDLQVRTESESLDHFTPVSHKLTVIRGERQTASGGYKEFVRWNLCRQGSPNCIKPPDAETADRCSPPVSQRALLELRLEQQAAALRALGKARSEYLRLQQQARQWQNDYDTVSRDCTLMTAAKALGGFLVGNFAPGAGQTDAGKALVNLLNFVEKLTKDDVSWALPNTEYKGWVSAEDIWDGVKTGLEALDAVDASPAEMRKAMLSCGAPSIAGAVEGALKYLSLLEQMVPLLQELNTILNDVRQIDIDIAGDEWPKYHAACVEYEQCREGGDPSRCDHWPPP